MKSLRVLLILGLGVAAGAQTFDVASVKPNKTGTAGGEGRTKESISISPDSLTLRNVTLRSCIRWAYRLGNFEVSGPGWIDSQRYDVVAKTGAPATPEKMKRMLQALLESRFHLASHREAKELSVYELVAAKSGTALKASEGDGESEMRPGDGDLSYRHYSMAEFADKLTGIPFRVDRPVVDKTGLTGSYDFKLKIAGNAVEMKSNFEHADGPVVFDVLRQIGLKLDAKKRPVEMFLVDSADRNPTEN